MKLNANAKALLKKVEKAPNGYIPDVMKESRAIYDLKEAGLIYGERPCPTWTAKLYLVRE